MTQTLYPIFYGTRLVPFDVIESTFRPHMHPEAWARGSNFLIHQGGKFGVGGGFRPPGTQPNRPGFAPPGRSFHEAQWFPSGAYYCAWDLVVVNPGHNHRAPLWEEVPKQGQQLSFEYGMHMNVPNEPWHIQPIELDAWSDWFNNGKQDLRKNYPFKVSTPRPQPPQPPVPPTQVPSKEVTLQINSRALSEGTIGNDVKFFQRQLNELAGQGLLLDGYYGKKTTDAVKNWQKFFNLTVDGKLGPVTQKSIIEISLKVS